MKLLPRFATTLLLFLFTVCLMAQGQFVLGGTITGIDGAPLENVPVRITTAGIEEITHTDATGYYEFEVIEGADYQIEPSSAANPRQGISTLDLVIIENHILGLEFIDSPYKMIAADVNNDAQISSFDIIELQKLILWLIPEFSSGKSWRFVDADFVFPDPTNPWATAFPETANLNALMTNHTDIDFIGIKLGDVNCSADGDFEDDPCDFGCGKLVGSVYYDTDQNCQLDGTESTLSNWMITATSPNDVQYAFTDGDGQYILGLLQNETYEVSLSPINSLWSACQGSQTITLVNQEIVQFDFLAQAVEDCHLLTVDMDASFLRRCFESNYAVRYCNFGTTMAEDASIDVTFDENLEVVSSVLPWSSQTGNTYTFDVGDVAAYECQTFLVKVLTSCDTELGQSLCSDAMISPASNCLTPPDWDGSNIEVTGDCDGDAVVFEIINTGDPMLETLEYIVIEDDMIMMIDNSSTTTLATNETKQVSLPANGSTFRMEVAQNSGHPFSQLVSVTVEGCGENANGEVSLGFVNSFPQYSSSPASTTNCSEVVGSFDPNDKAATPTGAQAENYIEQNIDLDYTIRFQNTGTDTAFFVIIRDTLSDKLDISSFRLGPSSHDYQYSIIDDNILEFTFPDIMLPDSFVNEPGSNGFVKFHLAQNLDNPIGTVIENNAAIYFDFNEPVITNTVFHTVGEDFLDITSVVNDKYNLYNLSIIPNPMIDYATILIDSPTAIDGDVSLYDATGNQLYTQSFIGKSHRIDRNQLIAGMYIFKIVQKGQLLSTGKLIVQ